MRRPFEPHAAHHHRLARRAAAGDRAAFVELYRALYPPIARFVARRARATADAEDVVARTFERLLEALPSLDPGRGPVLGFAITLARNLCADLARAGQAAGGAEAPDVPDEAAGAEARLLHDERLEGLARVLDALPGPTREFIELRFGDGLSHAEIAAMTGASEAAVRQRVSRALRALREALIALEEVTP